MGKDEETEYPLITIGICCYNAEDTVARAIDSALAQNWPNFELVIVDDGSTDKTPEIIAEKIKNRPHTRFIQHEENKSFPGALNTVIEEAKGALIAIFDDDDESLPHRLSAQYKTIAAYEKKTGARLVACWGSGLIRYPNGYEVHYRAIGSAPEIPVGTTVADYLLFFGKKPGVFYGSGTPSCALMTRKATYETVGVYDTAMFRSEDSDFAIRLALAGGHFIGTAEEVLVRYSTGGDEKKAETIFESYQKLMEKYRNYLIGKKRYQYAMLWNRLRLYHFGKRPFRAFLVLLTLFFRFPLLTWTHFWSTAPRRLIHEAKMRRKAGHA